MTRRHPVFCPCAHSTSILMIPDTLDCGQIEIKLQIKFKSSSDTCYLSDLRNHTQLHISTSSPIKWDTSKPVVILKYLAKRQ